MPKEEIQRRIDDNLSAIRKYLRGKFPGWTITEESFPNRYHWFIVTHGSPFMCHKLKVNWVRLWRRDYTPERTRRQLNIDLVASGMVHARFGYFPW